MIEDHILKAVLQVKEETKANTEDIKEIKEQLGLLTKKPDALFKEDWMDGQDVMLALNISKRTLQTLRSSGKLIPSRLDKKYYYKVPDIKQLLEENYIKNHLSHKP